MEGQPKLQVLGGRQVKRLHDLHGVRDNPAHKLLVLHINLLAGELALLVRVDGRSKTWDVLGGHARWRSLWPIWEPVVATQVVVLVIT